jgi:hypothetical protein
MIQRSADATALAEELSPPSAGSSDALEVPASSTGKELEELLNYTPVPPRNTRMVVVQFRLGARLKPLPYSLDDENP